MTVIRLAWGARVSKDFVARLNKLCKTFQWDAEKADWLMACMAFESAGTFSPSIRNAAGSGACVDTETQILTQSGWKSYNQVNVGDIVYSINFEKNEMELDTVRHLTVKESADNYKMTSRSFDSVSSGDHTWYLLKRYYCRTDNSPELVSRTSKELFDIKSSCSYNLIHPSMDYISPITQSSESPLLWELIGFIAGDGSINKSRGRIELVCDVKAAPESHALIKECIASVFPEGVSFDFTKGKAGTLCRWRLNKVQSARLIKFFDEEYNSTLSQARFVKKLNPEIFKNLDYNSALALLTGYLYSDGHFCKSNNSVSFRNTEPTIVDDFCHVAILCGNNPRICVDKRGGSVHTFPSGRQCVVKDIYTVYLRDARFTSVNHLQLKKEHITELLTVWCPTTFNGNWIARRNGTVYVTGNCGLIQFMPRTAQGLGTTTEELAKMTAVEQLDWVEKYFRPYRHRVKTMSDMYMAILWPAAVGKVEEFVLFSGGIAYRQNAGLDTNKDGIITKREAAAKVAQRLVMGKERHYAWVEWED
jgi:hypothetical protein